MKYDQRDSYLKLFASCVLVKGERQSLIYDFQRGEVYRISNTLCEILKSIENFSFNELLEKYPKAEEVIKWLLEKEILHITKEPECFPPLSEDWFSPEEISNAVIEVTFDSDHDYPKLFSELKDLHCKSILIKISLSISGDEIEKILEIALFHEIYFIEFWILGKLSTIKRNVYIRKFPILRKMLFLNSRKKKSFLYKQCVIQYSNCSSFREYCMTTYSNPIINYQFYCEAKNYNTCLNKKVSIDTYGNIKNCLYLEQSFGNYKDNSIRDIVISERFKQMWRIARDHIPKCINCEFRYMCTDCNPFIFNENIQTFQCLKDYDGVR